MWPIKEKVPRHLLIYWPNIIPYSKLHECVVTVLLLTSTSLGRPRCMQRTENFTVAKDEGSLILMAITQKSSIALLFYRIIFVNIIASTLLFYYEIRFVKSMPDNEFYTQ